MYIKSLLNFENVFTKSLERILFTNLLGRLKIKDLHSMIEDINIIFNFGDSLYHFKKLW